MFGIFHLLSEHQRNCGVGKTSFACDINDGHATRLFHGELEKCERLLLCFVLDTGWFFETGLALQALPKDGFRGEYVPKRAM
jgi:hypothetical protein